MLEVLDFLVDEIGLGGVLLIAAILALILKGGRKRRILGFALLLASIPISSKIAEMPLDASTIGLEEALSTETDIEGDAVLVFGAGVFADPMGGMWPTKQSVSRTAAGLALSERLGVPLVISGGIVRPDLAAEAVVLARVMRLPPDTILEAKARTTAENAAYVAGIVKDRGWGPVILVTSPQHTRRALAAARSAGIEISAVVDISAGDRLGAKHFVPGANGLSAWGSVVHEYVGILWYMLSGRIDPSELVG